MFFVYTYNREWIYCILDIVHILDANSLNFSMQTFCLIGYQNDSSIRTFCAMEHLNRSQDTDICVLVKKWKLPADHLSITEAFYDAGGVWTQDIKGLAASYFAHNNICNNNSNL